MHGDTEAVALNIRPEQPGDALAIGAILRSAFPSDLEARLVEALRSAGHLTLSMVAVDAGMPVGHVALSPVHIEAPAGPAAGVGLAPVAVLPAYQRRGIAAAMIEEGLARVRDLSFPFVVVLGEPHYYQRFGFRPAHHRGIGNEYGAADEFMVLELAPGGIPDGPAVARYAPEFGLFG